MEYTQSEGYTGLTGKQRFFNALRRPDAIVYRTSEYVHDWYARLCGAKSEQRRERRRAAQWSAEQIRSIRVGPRPAFFVDPSDLPLLPYYGRLIAYADRVCNHEVDLLGSGIIALGNAIDWHRDAVSGFRWPLRFVGDLSMRGDVGADIKWVWELSRFQYLPSLGIALRLTNDLRNLRAAQDMLIDWLDKNPVYHGPNWLCAMDVAIRACNWTYWWQLVRHDDRLDSTFVRRFLASLETHGRFIDQNLERHPNNTNNHYLADLAGLIYLGVLFPEFPDSSQWLSFARRELEKQIWRQLQADGVSFEASIPYHRLALELITIPALLLRANGLDLAYETWCHLERAFEFVAAYTPVHGLVPQIGDNDNGRLHTIVSPFTRPMNDHHYLLALAARLFPDNATFARAYDSIEEADWLLPVGKTARTAEVSPAPPKSTPFPVSGIYVMRSRNIHCLVDCGNVGLNGVGAHAHNDTLSFTLSVGDSRVIVDPGTGGYSRSMAVRNRFRSTACHNTVQIDGREINEFPADNPFRMIPSDFPKVLSWTTNDDTDRLSACHYGYNRLPSPVVHMRTIELDKPHECVSVNDRFLESLGHVLEWHLPLDPTAKCEILNEQEAVISSGRWRVKLTLGWRPDRFEIQETKYSESYGRIEQNTTIHIVTDNSDERSYAWQLSCEMRPEE